MDVQTDNTTKQHFHATNFSTIAKYQLTRDSRKRYLLEWQGRRCSIFASYEIIKKNNNGGFPIALLLKYANHGLIKYQLYLQKYPTEPLLLRDILTTLGCHPLDLRHSSF